MYLQALQVLVSCIERECVIVVFFLFIQNSFSHSCPLHRRHGSNVLFHPVVTLTHFLFCIVFFTHKNSNLAASKIKEFEYALLQFKANDGKNGDPKIHHIDFLKAIVDTWIEDKDIAYQAQQHLKLVGKKGADKGDANVNGNKQTKKEKREKKKKANQGRSQCCACCF